MKSHAETVVNQTRRQKIEDKNQRRVEKKRRRKKEFRQ
jgi:hypothetical protein